MKIPFRKKTPLLCAIMKLEAPYVLEWVAWHKLQGFDIMIADNCTEGRQTELLRKMRDAGLIYYKDCRDVLRRPQMPAYRDMFRRAFKLGYKYIGFLDGDEFFEPLKGDRWDGANLVAKKLQKPFIWAVSYRWAVFGSNDLKCRKNNLVMEDFTRCAESGYCKNQAVKSFARVSALLLKEAVSDITKVIYTPHVFRLWSFVYCLDGERFKVRKDDASPQRWNEARVRHYAVKSEEEYQVKKSRRGGAFSTWDRFDNYWESYNINTEDSPLPPEMLQKLKLEIENIKEKIQI